MTKMTKKEIIHMLTDFGEWRCHMHGKIQEVGGVDIWGEIPFDPEYLKFWTGETVSLTNWDPREERDRPTYFSLTIPIAAGGWTGELRGYLKSKWYNALHFADPNRAPMALYDMVYKVANGRVDLTCPVIYWGREVDTNREWKIREEFGDLPAIEDIQFSIRQQV
jgi:hypothetical protein